MAKAHILLSMLFQIAEEENQTDTVKTLTEVTKAIHGGKTTAPAIVKKDELFKIVQFILDKCVTDDLRKEETPTKDLEQNDEEEDRDKDGEQEENVIHDKSSISNDNNSDKKDPCPHHAKGMCKHGYSGKKDGECKYYHQKVCDKYKRNGTFPRGCQKGTDCPKLHINFCRDSLKNRMCLRKDCRFKHLPMTSFEETREAENKLNSIQTISPWSKNTLQKNQTDFLSKASPLEVIIQLQSQMQMIAQAMQAMCPSTLASLIST